MVDPEFGNGGFVRMCKVATTPGFDAHAHRVAGCSLALTAEKLFC